MNRPYIEQFEAVGTWEPLSEENLGFAGTLTAHADNSGPILIRVGDTGTEVELIPGEYFSVLGCDISSIQIQDNGQTTALLKVMGVTNSGW